MDWVREYWWAIAIGVVVLLALLLLLRPKQKVKLTESTPVRPHMQQASSTPPKIEAAKIAVPAGRASRAGGDDLCRLKGVGPKFADALEAAGLTRFEQIAALSGDEVDALDEQLGSFRGRLKRDRVVEQADFLARDDVGGFEARFGKL